MQLLYICCIEGGIIGIGKMGKFGWRFDFHVELPGTKTLHQQIIGGIFRTWIFQRQVVHRFSNEGKNSNDQDANHAINYMAYPLDITFRRTRLAGINFFAHH
jgi:hypothetical protein